MAIADTITSMQNHTSNAYTMIGYGTDLTGINKNLENLSSSIFNAFLEALRTPDTLFTNLPKITGSGSVISLNDTANAPMRITLGATELSQDATPTPSSPQDIHTISGDNKIVVSNSDNTILQEADIDLGYDNLFSMFKEISSGNSNGIYYATTPEYIMLSGTSTNYSSLYSKGGYNGTSTILSMKANHTYRFLIKVFDNVNNVSMRFYIGTTGANVLGKDDIYNGIYYIDYTPTTDSVFNQCSIIGAKESGKTHVETKIQIAFYDITNKVVSDYSQYGKNIEYCKIGNYEDKFIRTSGKNEYDINTNPLENSSTTRVRTTGYISLKAGTHTISYTGANKIYAVYYNSNNTKIGETNWTTGDLTFTFNQDYKYVFYFGKTGDATITASEVVNVMLNEGTTALPYEPYGSNEWYIKKSIGKVVLDGTESWNLDTTKTITQVFQKTTKIDDKSIDNNFLCNYFINQAGDTEKVSFGNTGNQFLYLAINKTTASTVAELQTWLGTHNTIVYYVLATPTYTQITGTLASQLENVYQKLLSYSGTTTISQINADLPFNMSVLAIEE